jgi:predicted transposase YbfD/YdcC
MDTCEYSTLSAALADITDPRKQRGKRHAWIVILVLIAAAMTNGACSEKAIARWVGVRREELTERLKLAHGVPSASTLRRALQTISVETLEARLNAYVSKAEVKQTKEIAPEGDLPGLQGQSIDGKTVRGLRRYGRSLHLVSLVRHGSGVVLNQVAVSDKSNEITAVPQLLAKRDLTGTVTTMDALLTQRSLCQQILDQGGHYLVVVKRNHPSLYDDIALLFEGRPWTIQEKTREYQSARSCQKQHGRIEIRMLETSTSLADYLAWPGLAQVMVRHSQRTIISSGKTTNKITYAITSLSLQQANADQLAAIWRAHWTIENQVHYVRDVTFAEDACHVRTGRAPQALAAFRNAVLSLFRLNRWRSIPDAIDFYRASLDHTLKLVGFSGYT